MPQCAAAGVRPGILQSINGSSSSFNRSCPYVCVDPRLNIHVGLAKALGLPGVGAGALLDDDSNSVGDLDNG